MLEKLIETAKNVSRKIVEEGEEVGPHLLIMRSNGSIAVVQIKIMGGISTGEAVSKFAPQILHSQQAVAYVFMCKTWVATRDKPLPPGTKVLDLPLDDRNEAVIVVAIEKKRPAIGYAAIIRNMPKGRTLGRWDRWSEMQGRTVITDW